MTTAQANDVRRVLVRALELLEQGWCQKCFTQAKDGRSVRACHASAVCWCPLGAIRRARFELRHQENGTARETRNE